MSYIYYSCTNLLLDEYFCNINNTLFVNNHLIYVTTKLHGYFYNNLNTYIYNREIL